MDEWDMDPSAGDIELECPACSASVGYNDVISTAAGGARCPVCGEESEPDEWFE